MKTIRRMIYSEVLAKVGWATLGFIALFIFFDSVDELKLIGKGPNGAYTFQVAALYVVFMVPNHLYELMPITVLIGTISVMARFAKSSEFTIMRTSGLGPWKALKTLLELGFLFVVFAFVVGDYVTPYSSRQAQLLKAVYLGETITQGNSGAWLKENRDKNSFIVNVQALSREGELSGITIYEFNQAGKLNTLTKAASGNLNDKADSWTLNQVTRQNFAVSLDENIDMASMPSLVWPTQLKEDMVSVALLKPERMATLDLFHYIQHLKNNGQASHRYEIDFWKKVFYPLGCLVMVVLALTFAYLHLRNTSMNTMVFAGVVIGITFVLFNNLFGYIGNLNDWSPWLAAATPCVVFMVGSLAVFSRLVLRH